MDLNSVLTAVGIVVTVGIAFITIRRSIHGDRVKAEQAARQERATAIAEAVKNATDPLTAQLTERTTERNYWRERADDLQDQLNNKKA